MKHYSLHVLLGACLGTLAGVFLGWATGAHAQFLVSDWALAMAAFGAFGGALCGYCIAVLRRLPKLALPHSVVLCAAFALLMAFMLPAPPIE
jgi:hypothetical protein